MTEALIGLHIEVKFWGYSSWYITSITSWYL